MITIEHLQTQLAKRKAQAEAVNKDIEGAAEFLKQKQAEGLALNGAIQQLETLIAEAAKQDAQPASEAVVPAE
jgi:predicted  nucleic acid-binding Zn-ribbon protein